MKNYEYAVFTNATDPHCCNDDADWYSDEIEAIKAAREAIANGVNPIDVEILKFCTDTDDVVCDYPKVTFDEDGGVWQNGLKWWIYD